jgi:hypothetical protein
VKRGGPLKRYTELKPGKPLERTAPLKAAGNLDRFTPLRKQSTKRQRENRQRRQMLKDKYGTSPVVCEVPWCKNVANDPHEPLTRARGGSITDPDNVRAVCRSCHDEIGKEPAWAYELGFLRHSWEVA